MIQQTKNILIPSKFLALALHLISATMLYFSYQDNIIAAYPSMTSVTSTEYVGGKASFMAANTLTIIFLAVELILLFVGVNLFKERHSLIVSTLHIVGCILYAAYGLKQWQFDTLWALWAVFSLFPLIIQILGACFLNQKRQK